MSAVTQLIVFSDLDGTLLDHDTYSWDEARPALEALRRYAVPLVLVTSKTRAEILPIRAALGNVHPYIVENGAAAYMPEGYFSGFDEDESVDGERRLTSAPSREHLLEVLNRVRLEGDFSFQGFSRLGAHGIARLTGLSQEQAVAANERAFSEPLLWQDAEARLEAFAAMLAQHELRCVRGGRFVHVMGRFDKADLVTALLSRYARMYEGMKLDSVVLGDGPNDLQMLAQADIAVVVKGMHPHEMPLQTPSRVIHTSLPGPAGWRDAVMTILLEEFSAV